MINQIKKNYTKLKKITQNGKFLHQIKKLKIIHQIKNILHQTQKLYTKHLEFYKNHKKFTANTKNFTPNI